MWLQSIPNIIIKIWVYCDETRLSQLLHYASELLELIFYFFSQFTSKLQQQIRKCAIRVYYVLSVLWWGSIRKLWLLGIPDITMKIWVCWNGNRVCPLLHYVCPLTLTPMGINCSNSVHKCAREDEAEDDKQQKKIKKKFSKRIRENPVLYMNKIMIIINTESTKQKINK